MRSGTYRPHFCLLGTYAFFPTGKWIQDIRRRGWSIHHVCGVTTCQARQKIKVIFLPEKCEQDQGSVVNLTNIACCTVYVCKDKIDARAEAEGTGEDVIASHSTHSTYLA